jgi:argininosuccinate lyase
MVSEVVASLVVSDTQRMLDHEMVPYDIQATRVHVEMLGRAGIVSKEATDELCAALDAILADHAQGTFEIDPNLGAQLTLEREVIRRVGEEVGLAMHTARSRNDQVMVTETLFVRVKVRAIRVALDQVVQEFLKQASNGLEIPMPGYTHMQPGKPTALSHWYLAHADCLARAGRMLDQVMEEFDQCPLGSVESFGTTWPIDRLYVAHRLGFSRVWEVPQDAISNRGVFQLAVVGALNQVALGVGRIAADLMLYSTHEFNMVTLSDEVAERLHPITGSSVMAQKRNPDALELLRGSAAQFGGIYASMSALLGGLPTGYNRDSREVKEYIGAALRKMAGMLQVLHQVVVSTRFNLARMQRMVDENYSLTTDIADQLAQRTGIPYRRMYKIVGQAVDELMKQGAPLTTLSEEMLSREAQALGVACAIPSGLLSELLSASGALARRQHIGGTAAKITRCMLRRRGVQV